MIGPENDRGRPARLRRRSSRSRAARRRSSRSGWDRTAEASEPGDRILDHDCIPSLADLGPFLAAAEQPLGEVHPLPSSRDLPPERVHLREQLRILHRHGTMAPDALGDAPCRSGSSRGGSRVPPPKMNVIASMPSISIPVASRSAPTDSGHHVFQCETDSCEAGRGAMADRRVGGIRPAPPPRWRRATPRSRCRRCRPAAGRPREP